MFLTCHNLEVFSGIGMDPSVDGSRKRHACPDRGEIPALEPGIPVTEGFQPAPGSRVGICPSLWVVEEPWSGFHPHDLQGLPSLPPQVVPQGDGGLHQGALGGPNVLQIKIIHLN